MNFDTEILKNEGVWSCTLVLTQNLKKWRGLFMFLNSDTKFKKVNWFVHVFEFWHKILKSKGVCSRIWILT